MDSALIKIKLCKKYGCYELEKLQSCVPDIALEINTTAKATRDTFPREIYDGLMDLANRFVSFNELVNSPTINSAEAFDSNLKSLLEEVDKLKEFLKNADSKK